jgi:hypothetical protein
LSRDGSKAKPTAKAFPTPPQARQASSIDVVADLIPPPGLNPENAPLVAFALGRPPPRPVFNARISSGAKVAGNPACRAIKKAQKLIQRKEG